MMLNNIGYWNIRGAHDISKAIEAKFLLSSTHLDLLILCETKLCESLTTQIATKIAPTWNMIHNHVHASYGRLMMIYNPLFLSITNSCTHRQYIHTSLSHIPTNTAFNLTAIYADNNKSQRQQMLDILPTLHITSIPWLRLGDFNYM